VELNLPAKLYFPPVLVTRQGRPTLWLRRDELADLTRTHWSIENRLHWARDIIFAEDLSQIGVGQRPSRHG
jgi:hypothetical protein